MILLIEFSIFIFFQIITRILNNLTLNFFKKFILNNLERLKFRSIKEKKKFNEINYLAHRILKTR